MFSEPEDIAALVRESKKKDFGVGVHFPLRRNTSVPRLPLLLSADTTTRQDAFQRVDEEFTYLSRLEPDYVLLHYPMPVVLEDRLSWDGWKFMEPDGYVLESKTTFGEVVALSERLFCWLSDKSQQFGFSILLELDALHRYFYASDFLERLLLKHPSIGLCLDTGRLYLQERLDPRFDARGTLRKYARYAKSVHLWNVQFIDGRICNAHHPALPELSQDRGWAPIEDYLKIVREQNSEVRILFEHQSERVSDDELQECYLWIDSIMNGRKHIYPR